MRTTLDLPQALLEEAMRLTNIATKTDVIKTALMNLIQREKIKGINKYRGKLDLGIDLDSLRGRRVLS
jgi:hypothetical protein